jgi:hypothetical protein
LESPTLSPDDGAALTIDENPPIRDGPEAALGLEGVTRLVVYDVAPGARPGEHVCLADSPREKTDLGDATSFGGVVEMPALDGNGVPMLERRLAIGTPTASTGTRLPRLWHAEVLDDTTVALGTPVLDAAAFVPTRKRPAADFDETVPFLHDVQGLAFAPDDDPGDGLRTLLPNADDDVCAETPQRLMALPVSDDALAGSRRLPRGADSTRVRRPPQPTPREDRATSAPRHPMPWRHRPAA